MNHHEEVDFENFQSIVSNYANNGAQNSCLWLKYEPFIVHVQCLDLTRAHRLLNTALAAGCRNSGITLGKNDKFMVAIRSTSSMEIPIHSGQDFTLDQSYLKFLCNESNRRLRDNLMKLEKFLQQISSMLAYNPEDKPLD